MLTKVEVNKWLNLTENKKLKIHTLINSVDALLADVRALVDEVRIHHILGNSPEANNCPICKALAAVEARMK